MFRGVSRLVIGQNSRTSISSLGACPHAKLLIRSRSTNSRFVWNCSDHSSTSIVCVLRDDTKYSCIDIANLSTRSRYAIAVVERLLVPTTNSRHMCGAIPKRLKVSAVKLRAGNHTDSSSGAVTRDLFTVLCRKITSHDSQALTT